MPITFNEKNRVFKLDAGNSTYAFLIEPNGYIAHLCYGGKIDSDALEYLYRPMDRAFFARRARNSGPRIARRDSAGIRHERHRRLPRPRRHRPAGERPYGHRLQIPFPQDLQGQAGPGGAAGHLRSRRRSRYARTLAPRRCERCRIHPSLQHIHEIQRDRPGGESREPLRRNRPD